MVFEIFWNISFLPVVVTVLTIFLILSLRPSFFIVSKDNPSCPFCLNSWLVTIFALFIGGLTYYFVNSGKIDKNFKLF